MDQAAILLCYLFIICIKCLSENTASLIHFTIGGGYGSIRPLPLVEVNQAILAWSFYESQSTAVSAAMNQN
jgi:hypothetical protein